MPPIPAVRKYRAALAKAIEGQADAFRALLAAGVTTESRLFRAVAVRLIARAVGLGGGMGPFLVEPLLEELRSVAEVGVAYVGGGWTGRVPGLWCGCCWCGGLLGTCGGRRCLAEVGVLFGPCCCWVVGVMGA